MQGVQGGVYQMLNHGISTGGLFLIVGMIYERRHTRMIADFGGLSGEMPRLAVFFMIVTLSSIALPGTNGFVGEFLILLGAFRSNVLYGVLAAAGVVLGAVYMLRMFQRVMFGKITKAENRGLPDLTGRETAILAAVVFFVFLMGLYPNPFFRKMDASVTGYLSFMQARTAVCTAAGNSPFPGNGAESGRKADLPDSIRKREQGSVSAGGASIFASGAGTGQANAR
jgi:NADH-quinone oxidoreductase subunit M